MTKEELATRLNGREIGSEIDDGEEAEAKKSNLVVVFGASDDLTEFRGAISDEAYPSQERPILLDNKGLLPEREQIDDDEELEQFFARKKGKLSKLQALWCKEKGYSWTFMTSIPHATFEVVEGEEKYCRGIVFSMADL